MTSTADVESSRPLRKDAARNRGLLVAAGRRIFAERGLEASLDEVARQAGVGIGTAYRHFANKFELAEAIMHEAIEEVIEAAESAASMADPWQGLVRFLETVLDVQTKDRGLREVLMGAGGVQKPDDIFDRLDRPIQTIMDRARAAGQIRPDVAATDLGCIIAMLCEVSDLGADTEPPLWRRYFEVLLAGLRPDGPLLTGQPLSDEQFRELSERHHALRIKAATD